MKKYLNATILSESTGEVNKLVNLPNILGHQTLLTKPGQFTKERVTVKHKVNNSFYLVTLV